MITFLASLLEFAVGSAFVPLQHGVQLPRNHLSRHSLQTPPPEHFANESASPSQVTTCLALGVSFGVALGLSSRTGGKVARRAFGWKTLKKWFQRGKKQEAPEAKEQEAPEDKKQEALETKKQEEAPVAESADDATLSATIDTEATPQDKAKADAGSVTADTSLSTAFNFFDKDKNGSIDKEELKSVMISLGRSPNAKELDDVMAEADTDGNGTIDFEEFRSIWGGLGGKKEASGAQPNFWTDAYAQLMAFGDDLEKGWNDKTGQK